MKKKIKQPKKLSKGFSLFEMMLSLAVLGTIMGISYGIMHSVQKNQSRSASLDLIKAQENIAVKYLNNNYDAVYKKILSTGSTSTPIVTKLSDISTLINTSTSTFNNSYDVTFNTTSFYPTCLIISADTTNKKLNVYMLYPKKNIKDSVFTKGEVAMLSGEKMYSKVIDSGSPLISRNLSNIKTGCNIPDIYPNSMLVNLNKNMDFSAKKVMTTDNTQTYGSTSETIKFDDSNLLNRTMSTNLYFDAIVKESTPYSNNYCDSTQAQALYSTKVHDTCAAYAQSHSTFLDGVEKITNGALVGNQCQYTAAANFSGYFTSTWVGGYTPTEVTQQGQPYINAGCQYNSTHSSTSNPGKLCAVPFAGGEVLNPNRGCKYGNTYNCTTGGVSKIFTICADDTNGNQTYVNQGCQKTDGPWENGYGHNGDCTAAELSYGGYYLYGDSVLCKIGGGTSSQETCGTFFESAFVDRGVTPPQHKFQGISFGDKGRGNVMIKSATPDGSTMESEVALNVSNAGVKSGYVLIKSQPIAADTGCTAGQIGKIVQQQNDNTLYTASQLVCTYDPDFCGGTGYCLSPLKSQSLMVENTISKSNSICPSGLRLDTSVNMTVASGMLDSSPVCSATFSGQSLISPTNGTLSIIADNGSGSKRIYGYSSICKYSGGANYPLSNIKKLKCISAAQTKSFNNCKGNENGIVTCS